MSTLAFGFYPSKTYTCKARPAISVRSSPFSFNHERTSDPLGHPREMKEPDNVGAPPPEKNIGRIS